MWLEAVGGVIACLCSWPGDGGWWTQLLSSWCRYRWKSDDPGCLDVLVHEHVAHGAECREFVVLEKMAACWLALHAGHVGCTTRAQGVQCAASQYALWI